MPTFFTYIYLLCLTVGSKEIGCSGIFVSFNTLYIYIYIYYVLCTIDYFVLCYQLIMQIIVLSMSSVANAVSKPVPIIGFV